MVRWRKNQAQVAFQMKTQYRKELHPALHHIDLIAAVLLAVGRCVIIDVPSNTYSLSIFKPELISILCIV